MIACQKGFYDVVKLLLEHSNVLDLNFSEGFDLSKEVKKLIWNHLENSDGVHSSIALQCKLWKFEWSKRGIVCYVRQLLKILSKTVIF